MHAVLAYVQERVPTATGMALRNGHLIVTYAQPPDDAARVATRAALADQPALEQLAARSATGSTAAAATPAGDLRTQLLDTSLNDDAWLRLFRRYQVAVLSGGEATPEAAVVRRDGGAE